MMKEDIVIWDCTCSYVISPLLNLIYNQNENQSIKYFLYVS